MVIVETQIFTKRVVQAIDDEQYRRLQSALVAAPQSGAVIPSGGGLRKLRWAGSGRGKRGGARVIYRWFPEQDRLLMLFVFLKNERDGLSGQQLRRLRLVAESEFS
jgi:hypothetical protein